MNIHFRAVNTSLGLLNLHRGLPERELVATGWALSPLPSSWPLVFASVKCLAAARRVRDPGFDLGMRTFSASRLLAALSCLLAGLSKTAGQEFNQLKPVPIQSVTIEDPFWSPKRKVWQEVTIPDCLTKFENDRGGALNNFDRVREGKSDGHAGPPWYDGLIYEMIRGAADFLAARPDPLLERRMDGYIARITEAQDRDTNGYLNTWTELEHPDQRWGLHGGNDGYQHEMYNVGALCDAAVHYYQATGKTRLLRAAVKLANYTCDQVGPSPKYELVPNHALAEEAFANLYLFFGEHPELKRDMPVAIDERRYRELAQYWVEARGHPRKDQPSYGAYNPKRSAAITFSPTTATWKPVPRSEPASSRKT
jgi:hypothetical protein